MSSAVYRAVLLPTNSSQSRPSFPKGFKKHKLLKRESFAHEMKGQGPAGVDFEHSVDTRDTDILYSSCKGETPHTTRGNAKLTANLFLITPMPGPHSRTVKRRSVLRSEVSHRTHAFDGRTSFCYGNQSFRQCPYCLFENIVYWCVEDFILWPLFQQPPPNLEATIRIFRESNEPRIRHAPGGTALLETPLSRLKTRCWPQRLRKTGSCLRCTADRRLRFRACRTSRGLLRSSTCRSKDQGAILRNTQLLGARGQIVGILKTRWVH